MSNCLKGIEIPRDLSCLLNEKENHLTIIVNSKGLVSNMQENAAAFDGWAIVIKANIPQIQRVTIRFEIPYFQNYSDCELKKQHYRRAIYRALCFQECFDWVTIELPDDEIANETQKEILGNSWVINYPNTKRTTECIGKKENPERWLEQEILSIWSNKNESFDNCNKQFPMGLFFKEKAKKNARTPNNQSKCDLWSIKDNLWTIYELKTSNNKPVGIISELFFYVNVAKDLIEKRVTFEDKALKSPRSGKELYTKILANKITDIKGVFLATTLHPLFEKQKQEIIKMLSNNKRGILFDVKPVSDWMPNY